MEQKNIKNEQHPRGTTMYLRPGDYPIICVNLPRGVE